MTTSSEVYTSQTLCEQTLVLEVFGEVGKVTKMTLGNRFFIKVKCYPSNSDNPEMVNWMFDYYKNFAPLLSWEELKRGWLCYLKARKQRLDDHAHAFWMYMDGKRIKVGKKGSVFEWV